MTEDNRRNEKMVDVFPPEMWEYPFVRMDMTVGEYLDEKKYYAEHFKEVHKGTYKPLWKQSKTNDRA